MSNFTDVVGSIHSLRYRSMYRAASNNSKGSWIIGTKTYRYCRCL